MLDFFHLLVLSLGLFFLAWAAWRFATRKQRQALRHQQWLSKARADWCRWQPTMAGHIDTVHDVLNDFLRMHLNSPQPLAMPSAAADSLWHLMQESPRYYQAYCQAMFGRSDKALARASRCYGTSACTSTGTSMDASIGMSINRLPIRAAIQAALAKTTRQPPEHTPKQHTSSRGQTTQTTNTTNALDGGRACLSRSLALTWHAACRYEHLDPDRPDRLPAVFGLDEAIDYPFGQSYAWDDQSQQVVASTRQGAQPAWRAEDHRWAQKAAICVLTTKTA